MIVLHSARYFNNFFKYSIRFRRICVCSIKTFLLFSVVFHLKPNSFIISLKLVADTSKFISLFNFFNSRPMAGYSFSVKWNLWIHHLITPKSKLSSPVILFFPVLFFPGVRKTGKKLFFESFAKAAIRLTVLSDTPVAAAVRTHSRLYWRPSSDSFFINWKLHEPFFAFGDVKHYNDREA